jgi:aminoglycoside phosphotransferase (APT) family kinase protein
VHGDLHPGNVRTDAAGRLTIMDWGDCFLGHPAFDILRLTESLDDSEPLLRAWAYRWKSTVPGSEPLRAAELLRPVAALRAAVTYAAFLDAIEPSEWPYHAADVPTCLATSIVKP